MESMNRSAILRTLSPSPDAAPHGGDGGGHPAAAAGIIANGERPVNSFAADQYAALFCASDCLSSFMMASGSPPALRTLSVHCFSSGSADFFHSPSCASVMV